MPQVIPITPVADDTVATLPDVRPASSATPPFGGIGRRRFLQGSAVLTGLLAIGSPIALLAPSRAWALELTHLDQPQADSIMALAKTLYPHPTLPDAVYALVVKDIDAKATDPKTATLVKDGVAKLDQSSSGKWLSESDADRTALVTANQSDRFVQLVRAQCITSLYDNAMAYAHFGYEGEAFSKGGYVYRGFNDLTWLPNPPESASPPVA